MGALFRRAPRINHSYTALLKIADIARGEGRTARLADRCDHGVRLRDGPAESLPANGNRRVIRRGIVVKGQYPAAKFLRKDVSEGRRQ